MDVVTLPPEEAETLNDLHDEWADSANRSAPAQAGTLTAGRSSRPSVFSPAVLAQVDAALAGVKAVTGEPATWGAAGGGTGAAGSCPQQPG